MRQLFILTIFLLGLLVTGHIFYQQQQKREGEIKEQQYQKVYDSLQSELLRTSVERDSLRTCFDSLNSASQTLVVELDKTKKQLRAVKGSYNHIPQDSLGAIMNRRAAGK